MNNPIFTVLGFLLFILGISSLVLSLVGVKLAFLTFIDAPGAGFGFLVKILMVIGGIVVIVLSRSRFAADMEEE